MRVAWASPLPPEGSGIADYSAELVPFLATRCELELFTADPQRSAARLPPGTAVRRYGELPARREEFDAVVYHLGNSAPNHEAIWKLLPVVPGVVVLHEFVLHHLVRELTLVRGDVAGFVDEMRYAYGETGRRLAEAFVETGLPLDPFSYPLFERPVDLARAVVVHNEHARRRIFRSRPRAPVSVVPMAFAAAELPAASAESRAVARRELGLAADDFLFASFGWVTPIKRTEATLRAFAAIRRELPRARLLLVGQVSPHYDLATVMGAGLAEGVTVVGRTSLDDFHRYMLASDVAVNLRHPSAGETSASLVRLLGLGLPVVVSDHGSFAEVPDGCCAKVPVDVAEEEGLAATLLALGRDRELREALGRAARAWAIEHHDPARAAERWIETVAAAGPAPGVPVPPLAPWASTDLATDLARIAGAALADLGVAEDDGDGPPALARAMVGLDLDRAWR